MPANNEQVNGYDADSDYNGPQETDEPTQLAPYSATYTRTTLVAQTREEADVVQCATDLDFTPEEISDLLSARRRSAAGDHSQYHARKTNIVNWLYNFGTAVIDSGDIEENVPTLQAWDQLYDAFTTPDEGSAPFPEGYGGNQLEGIAGQLYTLRDPSLSR